MPYAEAHDQRVRRTMRYLLALRELPPLAARQLHLPLRHGGLGLRSAVRTATAAYWGSLADCLHPLQARYPAVAAEMLRELTGASGFCPALQEASAAGRLLDAAGMRERPSWLTLLQGARPDARAPDEDPAEPGDWSHGWQFFASDALEQLE